MPATYVNIAASEFHEYMAGLKFAPITVASAKERVYGKIIGPNLCLRVFSGIVGESSRGCGEDAIRTAIVYRDNDGAILPVGKQKRVHRVMGWRNNLEKRITEATKRFHKVCKCGRPMVIRDGKNGEFWGCIGYPKKCTGCQNIENAIDNR